MKNIHLLPTDKPSSYVTNYMEQNMQWQNLYITSDEEIKEGDWFIGNINGIVKAYKHNLVGGFLPKLYPEDKKIILTTDTDLIKNGIQAIDDEFLEWFVKNPSCERVEVKKGSYNLSPMEEILEKEYVPKGTFDTYKIIIPKEEPKLELPQLGTKEFVNMCESIFGGKPKQETNLSKHLDSYPEYPGPRRSAIVSKQETLEEAAKLYIGVPINRIIDDEERYYTSNIGEYDAFIAGAKWQAEQDNNKFSEKVETLWVRYRKTTNNEDAWSFKEWLVEQFKNK